MFMKNKVQEALSKAACSLLALAMIAGPGFADETATLSIKSIPNVNVRMYGFMENDLINDSAQMEVADLSGRAGQTDCPKA